jgi:uncharacterized protein with FMN-binding domain
MGETNRKASRLPGKLLLSSALLVMTAGYATWQKKLEPPQAAAAPAPAQMEIAAPTDPSSGVGGYVFHEGPAAAAITMPAGHHVADGQYVSQEWESGFGPVKVKVGIAKGRFTAVEFLIVPDERQRSQELSHMAKPLLLHEMIHEQRVKVDVITTATYTTWAFQDALTDVIQQATRPAVPRDLPAPLEPLYFGSQ